MEDLGRLSQQNLINAVNKLRLHFKTFVTSIQPHTNLEKALSWEEACQQIYVQPQARNYFNAQDNVLLEARMQAFLQGDEQIAVIMGDPGAGKTTFAKRWLVDCFARYEADPDNKSLPLLIVLNQILASQNGTNSKKMLETFGSA